MFCFSYSFCFERGGRGGVGGTIADYLLEIEVNHNNVNNNKSNYNFLCHICNRNVVTNTVRI